MKPEDLESLLGAYALDAVDAAERRALDEYIAVNPRARAEVEDHREVATLLAYSGAPAPDGVWDRIVGALDEPPPVPGPELAKVLPMRRRRWPTVVVALGAAAAAAVAAVAVTAAVVRDDGPPAAAFDGLAQVFDDAMTDPDAARVVLSSDDGGQRAVAVVEPGGVGLVSGRDLPELPADRTYQLWGVIDDEVISLGVLGARPQIEPFSVDGDLTALVITNEVAGGVTSSQEPALLAGEIV